MAKKTSSVRDVRAWRVCVAFLVAPAVGGTLLALLWFTMIAYQPPHIVGVDTGAIFRRIVVICWLAAYAMAVPLGGLAYFALKSFRSWLVWTVTGSLIAALPFLGNVGSAFIGLDIVIATLLAGGVAGYTFWAILEWAPWVGHAE